MVRYQGHVISDRGVFPPRRPKKLPARLVTFLEKVAFECLPRQVRVS